MLKKYIIFDLDGTLINSIERNRDKIVKIIGEVDEKKINTAKYILSTTSWMPLLKQLEIIFDHNKNIDFQNLKNKIYENLQCQALGEIKFFPWTIEKLKELSNNYKLFITTANSTRFAKEELKKVGIENLFEEIIWSENVLKWKEHIDLFKEKSLDENFCRHAIYVGDGQRDREIAMSQNITFIHIGNEEIDTYEIPDISEIDEILEKIKKL